MLIVNGVNSKLYRPVSKSCRTILWVPYQTKVGTILRPDPNNQAGTLSKVNVGLMTRWTKLTGTNVLLVGCQGYVPLTLDVMRVAFKVPLAFHTPL